jgi:uncharacterized damage-inducible protein DinB
MQEMIKWIERQFHEKPDAGTFPMVVERLAGTLARVDEKIACVPPEMLTQRIGDAWTIQEHVGHLCDLEPLWTARLDEFAAGAPELTAADMSNQKTRDANHNDSSIEDLQRAFRDARNTIIERLESMDESTVLHAAIHPRLQRPMRTIDLCVFVAEHDDHHLARMSELWRALSGKSAVLSLAPRFR